MLDVLQLRDPDAGTRRAVQERSLEMLSRAHVQWHEGSLPLRTAWVEPVRRMSDRPVVVPMSFDYRLERLATLKLSIIGAVSGHPVLGVDTPGVTMPPPGSMWNAKVRRGPLWREVRAGRFSKLAAMQADAIRSALPDRLHPPVLLGHSFGAQMGWALCAAMPVHVLDVVEPVNLGRRSLVQMVSLARHLADEEIARTDTLALSRAEGWDAVAFEKRSTASRRLDRRLKSPGSQGCWVTQLGLGLRTSLLDQHPLPDVPIRTFFAADGKLVTVAQRIAWSTDVARNALQAQSFTVAHDNRPMRHHFMDDLDSLVSFVAETRSRWD